MNTAHEHISDAYSLGGGAFCDWGWCAEQATEGFTQRWPQADGSIVASLTPYCERHGQLNRECVATAARLAARRKAG